MGNADLAALFGVTPRHISRLADHGVIPKAARGKYQLGPCLTAYVAHLRKRSEKPLSQLDEEERRVRLAKLKGELADVHKTQRYLFGVARRIRDLILQTPARIAPQGATLLGVDLDKLRAWLDERLHALALETVEAAKSARDTLGPRPDDGDGPA